MNCNSKMFFSCCPLALLVILASGEGRSCAAQEISFSDRDISSSIVTSNGVVVTQVAVDIEIKARRSVFGERDNVRHVLIANAIFPDSDAFGLVYDLNPSLKSINSAGPNSELIMPFARSVSRSTLGAGQLVRLVVHSQLKSDVLAKVANLNEQTAAVNTLGIERFANANERRAVLRSLREIIDSSQIIRNVISGKVRPVTEEVLNQFSGELEMVQISLGRVIQSAGLFNDSDLSTLKSVEDDLRIKRRALTDVKGPSETPTRWRDVRVVVRTLRNGQPEPNLRVYYVPEALRGRSRHIRSFNTLGSPTERLLPEANYWIWAGKPGQEPEGSALSDVKRLELRRTSDASQVVDLSIIR